MTGDDKHLPLEDIHTAAGARFGAFAGWSMPLTYPAGVMKEHLHTREHVGLFDISHMKLFEVGGPEAAALLSRACPLDAGTLEISQSKLTFFLNEAGGILDDLIVTRLGDDRVFLAIQGPEAWAALSRAGIETGSLLFMHGVEPRKNWFMSRSGYTGEDGFEIGLPEADARDLVAKLLEDERVLWIGLAARDSLRLEAGLCLHGQDITPETDPAAAALLWAIPR
ncbi:MAG: glycine cleavage system aminomethyltransferase T, partial [Mesorhizobium sp.]